MMLQRVRGGRQYWRAVAVVGVLGALAAGSGRAQDAPAPKTVVAISTSEATDKDAIEKANKYFADLKADAKDDEKLKKLQAAEAALAKAGAAPGFPNPAAEPTGPSAAELAAAATVPALGVSEALLAAATPARLAPKPAPARYTWVKITGARELRILGLNKDGAAFKGATEAKDKVFVHPKYSFPIYAREAEGAFTFFLLTYEPDGKDRLTDADLKNVVRTAGGQPTIDLFFTAAGKEKLKTLTTAYKPVGTAPGRYLILTGAPGVLEIVRISTVSETGILRTGVQLGPTEFQALFEQFKALVPTAP